MNRIHVIGAGIEGQEGFSGRALELIRQAGLLIGRPAQLALFPDFAGEKMTIGDEMGPVIERLARVDRPTVVLCSGDPLFFGLGRELLRNLPDAPLAFVPNVSSVQYAFAKIGQPWDDAVFVSATGRGLRATVDVIVAHDKVAVLTDARHTPAVIARELMDRGRDGYRAWLCENLGTSGERIVQTHVRQLAGMTAATLNLLILVKEYEAEERFLPFFGIPDDSFAAVKRQITPEEVRVISLAKLQLRHDMTLWDIGAGSGSVSIEADHLLPNGRILAIERSPQCHEFIKQNLGAFNARNVTLVDGEAPACLEDLPDPDRVFIGGSGGNLWAILQAVDARLPADGRVVLNATTLDALAAASEFFDNAGYRLEVVAVNIARTDPDSDYKMFVALQPVYVITAIKQ